MLVGISLYDNSIEPSNKMIRRLLEPLRLCVTLLLLVLPPLFAADAFSSGRTNYHHLVVLVHGYLGSDREQGYLGESLMRVLLERKKFIEDENYKNDSEGEGSCSSSNSRHELAILNSKANVQVSTDGIAEGGKRLATEITAWIEEQIAEIRKSKSEESTVVTFSLIGNSLGGLYGRYALGELDFFRENNNHILPLIFCTTSSPHIGVSQETFIELPRWLEPHVATAFMQRTMDDLFGVNNSTVVRDMCNNPSERSGENVDRNNYLQPLQQFQKRIAVANAYKTDFLVSASSGAFLSRESNSPHHHQDSVTSSTRLMKDSEHVALQVITKPTVTGSGDDTQNSSPKSCVDSLDDLGWHKIFIDTRQLFPSIMNLPTPELKPRASYTSKELKDHFESFGTLFPVAHPLNMANSKTDLYRKLTQAGQPIVDSLAELLVLDMVELSEKKHRS